MSADDYYYDITKQNKWKHQLIHKKINKIHYASKHYGTSKLIQKRKNPVKQRKDRKKFKVQRNRKKIHKRMVFDYDDFLNKNKSENYKRIQTRPTVSYYYQHKHKQLDIDSTFMDYYNENNYNMQQTETLCNDIPIWQCDACTYINIEQLEFCTICSNTFKYDYDNNGFNNNDFYSIKYVTAKQKSNRKPKKGMKIKTVPNNKNNCNEFGKYWNEMTKWKSNYKQWAVNSKPKAYQNKPLIIVLSINNKKNGICLNYKPNQNIYGRIAHKNKLFFEPIIIAKILHYYPFYEIPVCLEPKCYQDLSKNNNNNNYYGMCALQYELSLIARQIKKQLQPKSVRNNTLERMINNYKISLKTIEKSAIESAQILSSHKTISNITETNEPNIFQHPKFDIQLDVLMYKKYFNTTSNTVSKYNQIFCGNGVGLDEFKQETFLLKEINLKTYNEKTFEYYHAELDKNAMKAAQQTNMWFDMFQDESEDEISPEIQPENKSYSFIFTNEFDRNVEICTSLNRFRSFAFYDNFYKQCDLKNDKLINIAKTCVDIIFENDDFDNDCQFRFDEKHIPHYNLLPLSFKISRILYAYLPAMDIIKNVFIPMIGYDKMYYVTINTQIRAPQKNNIHEMKKVKMDDCKDEIKKNENMRDDYNIAASYSVLYSQLIVMGFDEEISVEAVKKHSNNINNAIDWIRRRQQMELKKKKKTVMKYNYDMNWEAIALYEEEDESSSRFNRLNGGCRWCGNVFCSCYDSSSDDSSSSD